MHRIWGTKTIKTAIADDNITSLTEVEPDIVTPEGEHVVSVLKQGGWITDETGHGFAAGQPQFNFQLSLRHEDGTQKSEDELLKGMNQLWRRNIKKLPNLALK